MSKELGDRFSAWRDRNRKTQKQVADLLGVDKSTVAHWESGRKKPNLLRAADIEEKTEGAVTKEAIEAAHRKKKRT